MHLEVQDGLVELGLILAIATMLVIAPALRVPYPILLVVGGLVLGLVPGMPEFELPPELVFFGVLPPLWSSAAMKPLPLSICAVISWSGMSVLLVLERLDAGQVLAFHPFEEGAACG